MQIFRRETSAMLESLKSYCHCKIRKFKNHNSAAEATIELTVRLDDLYNIVRIMNELFGPIIFVVSVGTFFTGMMSIYQLIIVGPIKYEDYRDYFTFIQSSIGSCFGVIGLILSGIMMNERVLYEDMFHKMHEKF